MNRRKAMTIAAGVIAGGGAGLLTLTNAFKPEIIFDTSHTNCNTIREKMTGNTPLLTQQITADTGL